MQGHLRFTRRHIRFTIWGPAGPAPHVVRNLMGMLRKVRISNKTTAMIRTSVALRVVAAAVGVTAAVVSAVAAAVGATVTAAVGAAVAAATAAVGAAVGATLPVPRARCARRKHDVEIVPVPGIIRLHP